MKVRYAVLLAALCAVAGLAVGGIATGASKKRDPVLFGLLSGKNEIGTDGKKRAGDPDGRGGATGVIEDGKLCFGLTVANLDDPVAAHIHRAGKGRNGPVVIGLTAPEDGDPGASSGCVEVESALARAIVTNPRKFYWNVHTEAFPNGAVRGQVSTKR